jgi:hypothetical protein
MTRKVYPAALAWRSRSLADPVNAYLWTWNLISHKKMKRQKVKLLKRKNNGTYYDQARLKRGETWCQRSNEERKV